MAKLNGIEIKAMTNFKGHEGEPLTQGNLYFQGKKIGYYSEDSWGGQIDIDIEKEYQEEFNNIVEDYSSNVEDKFMVDETFIYDLINLSITEKEFKKAIKKGYKALVMVSHPTRYGFQISSPNGSEKDTIKWLEENGYEDYKVSGKYLLDIYTDLGQFVVENEKATW